MDQDTEAIRKPLALLKRIPEALKALYLNIQAFKHKYSKK